MENHATAVSSMLSMLDQFYPQPAEVRSFFLHETKLFSFRKGELLLKAGDYCEYIFFVLKGVVRGYIVDGEREVTTWLTCENELVTSISSLDVERPAVEHIEAVLDCTLLGMPVQKMDELYRLHPVFNITGRKLIQKYYRDAELRAYQVRLSSAEEKYLHFLDQYPQLSNRVPLKHIASFLNITIETLSRVRKRISI